MLHVDNSSELQDTGQQVLINNSSLSRALALVRRVQSPSANSYNSLFIICNSHHTPSRFTAGNSFLRGE